MHHQFFQANPMKLIPLIGALLLSASPTAARDYLYLRCKYSVDMVTTNTKTSKISEDRTIDDRALLKIDFKQKTVLDARSPAALGYMLQNKTMTIIQNIDDDETKLNGVDKIELMPPYSTSGTGTAIFKSKNETRTYSYEGSCEEIDASVFDEALRK
ncbi:hypothetical protein [Synechococcus sp. CC9616]|uniref:hypothetical protein n=1 Tax=Synechococcus sp. CC9616 TaxID=110663 RepID=UPI000564A51D|nr:hypothetical protein [Synechococcus sp. CC9616]